MALSTTFPIKRALVRLVRDSAPLKAALVGGIHQRLSPRKVRFPYLVYSEVSAPFVSDWGAGGDNGRREIDALYDLDIYDVDSSRAESLLEQLDGLLNGPGAASALAVEGQTVLLVETRAKTPMGPDRDAVGRRIDRVGITVHIQTDQPIPAV